MSESRKKRRVEMIESYWTGGEYGSDYVWSDNHGELIRCRNCKWKKWMDAVNEVVFCKLQNTAHVWDWFCGDGERGDGGD